MPQFRLLTPCQARLAQQLARLGVRVPAEVATMLGVPEERVRRSFRLARPVGDELADLQHLARVRLVPMDDER